jgi:hypothetical protein
MLQIFIHRDTVDHISCECSRSDFMSVSVAAALADVCLLEDASLPYGVLDPARMPLSHYLANEQAAGQSRIFVRGAREHTECWPAGSQTDVLAASRCTRPCAWTRGTCGCTTTAATRTTCRGGRRSRPSLPWSARARAQLRACESRLNVRACSDSGSNLIDGCGAAAGVPRHRRFGRGRVVLVPVTRVHLCSGIQKLAPAAPAAPAK